MKFLFALALLSSCSATLTDAGKYLAPNYLEVSYGDTEGDLDARDSAWNRDYDGYTITATLGWYLQPVPITTRDRSGLYDPIQAVNPDAEEVVASLEEITAGIEASSLALAEVSADAQANQEKLLALRDKTLLDNVGPKEAWGGGILTSLLGLFLLFRKLGILNGKTSTTDDD